MKVYTFFTLFITIASLFAAHGQAPVLYGTTSIGGANNHGTVFKINGDGNGFKVLFNFTAITGNVQGNLYQAPSNGLIYGMTQAGQLPDRGSIFCVNPVNDSVSFLYNFPDSAQTPLPQDVEDLVEVSDGVFYGVTVGGGTGTQGTVFRFDSAGDVCTELYSFIFPNYYYPDGRLVNVNGKLYGITQGGGPDSGVVAQGSIYTFNPANDSTKVVYYFSDTGVCCTPRYGPILYNGYLYGVTTAGVSNEYGMIYRLDPATGSILKIADFDSSSGSPVTNGLMACTNGLLYGVTNYGLNEVIYTVNPNTNAFNIAYRFQTIIDSIPQGAYLPEGNLTEGSDGMLYGMSYAGGLDNSGNIFRFNPDSNTYQNVYSFLYPDSIAGAQPVAGLLSTGTLPTGIKTPVVSSAEGITLVPNPAHNYTTVYAATPFMPDKIQLLDMLGNIIGTYNITSNRVEIETSKLAPAIYFVKVYDESGNSFSRKLVKY